MLKIFIADNSETVLDNLTESLCINHDVMTCSKGDELIPLLTQFAPDILVLDLMLPGIDGISLLKTLFSAGICPKVLATTTFLSAYVVNELTQMEVSYLMVKPCTTQAMLARISDIEMEFDDSLLADYRRVGNDILLQLGLRMQLRGYPCALEAIVYLCDHFNCSITKELYPVVAEKCGATSVQVERAIRTCIQKAYMKRNDEIWRLYFPVGRNGQIVHLTNAAFLTRIAYAVKSVCLHRKNIV